MAVNQEKVKFIERTRAQFDAIGSKDVNALYFVKESDNSYSFYLGNNRINDGIAGFVKNSEVDVAATNDKIVRRTAQGDIKIKNEVEFEKVGIKYNAADESIDFIFK